MPNLGDNTDLYYNTLHYTILHFTALKGMSENNVKLPSRYLILSARLQLFHSCGLRTALF